MKGENTGKTELCRGKMPLNNNSSNISSNSSNNNSSNTSSNSNNISSIRMG